jgi:hypothetical protein
MAGKNSYTVLVEKPEGRNYSEDLGVICEDNIKIVDCGVEYMNK